MESKKSARLNTFVQLKTHQLHRTGRIGHGTYGTVYAGYFCLQRQVPFAVDESSHHVDHQKARIQVPVAIKTFKRFPSVRDPGSSFPPWILREINWLRSIRHPNIVALRSVLVNRDPAVPSDAVSTVTSLVFPYAQFDVEVGTDMADPALESMILSHHRCHGSPVPRSLVGSVAYQCLHALSHLHAQHILHLDVKPQNILIMQDCKEQGVVKLCDFGLARSYLDTAMPLLHQGPVVTLWYRAPELLVGVSNVGPAVDLWAMGCVLGELLVGQALFRAHPSQSQAHSIRGDGGNHAAMTQGPAFEADQMAAILAVLGSSVNLDQREVENCFSSGTMYTEWKAWRKQYGDHIGSTKVVPWLQLGELPEHAEDTPLRSMVRALLRFQPTQRPSASVDGNSNRATGKD